MLVCVATSPRSVWVPPGFGWRGGMPRHPKRLSGRGGGRSEQEGRMGEGWRTGDAPHTYNAPKELLPPPTTTKGQNSPCSTCPLLPRNQPQQLPPKNKKQLLNTQLTLLHSLGCSTTTHHCSSRGCAASLPALRPRAAHATRLSGVHPSSSDPAPFHPALLALGILPIQWPLIYS